MPKYDILLKTLEPQLVASIRVPNTGSVDLGLLFQKVAAHIEASGAKGIGPGILMFHNTDEGQDAETAFPIAHPIPETDEIKVHTLPMVEKAACLVYKGKHEDMDGAYQAIMKWIEDNNYRVCGPNRLLFLDCGDDENAPGVAVVETQFPIELNPSA